MFFKTKIQLLLVLLLLVFFIILILILIFLYFAAARLRTLIYSAPLHSFFGNYEVSFQPGR